jgi:ketosteroid isomerase-like protein
VSFNAKVVAATAVIMGGALLFILFFRTSDEEAVEALLRDAAAAAERADADAVVTILSPDFKSPRGDAAWAERYIRERLTRSPGQIEVLSVVVQVSGDDATATIGLRGYVFKNELWRTALSLRLRRAGGTWKVVSAEEASS